MKINFKFTFFVLVVILVIVAISYFKSSNSVTGPEVAGMPAGDNAIYVPDQKPASEVFASIVVLKEPGYIIIHRDEGGAPGDIVGISEYFTSGEHWKVRVPLSKESKSGSALFAMLHKDNGDKTFSLRDDLPVGLEKGEVIMMRFLIDEKANPPADLVR